MIGDGRTFLTALIGIELDTVGEWAQRRRLGYTTYRDLSEKPEVRRAGRTASSTEVNARFAPVEQVKRVPAAAQGARPRGRRADRHPEGQAVRDRGSCSRTLVDDMYAGAGERGDRVPRGRRCAGSGTGSIYALLALGFVIIFKSTGVINFAQPAFMLAGAMITSYVARRSASCVRGLSFFPRSVAALLTAALALVVERTAIRPMVGRPAFVVAIITHRHRHRGPGGRQRRSSASDARPIPTPGGWTRVDVRRRRRSSSGTSSRWPC